MELSASPVKCCAVDGCVAVVFGRGWCTKHYNRWLRHGDPLTTTRTPPIKPDAVEKHCPRCGNIKPLDQFGKRPSGKPKGYCKPCEARYQDGHAATVDGREQRRVARARWNDNNHEYFLMYRYGITKVDYDRMLADQGGRCAVCGVDKPGGKAKVWCVDHCHDSNDVRGLLCGPCNRGLGQFKDDPQRLRDAANYLESGGIRPR